MRKERTRALIIGSGFGGAVAAHRLGSEGIDTVLLERGRRWSSNGKIQDMPFCTYDNPDGRAAWLRKTTPVYEPIAIDRYTGILEVHETKETTIFCGAGVGGGSLVYNAAMVQPGRWAFEKTFAPFAPEAKYELFDQEFYPRVKAMIGIEPIPQSILEDHRYSATRDFMEKARRCGLEPFLADCAIDWQIVQDELDGKIPESLVSGECWYGINSGAKRSLDKNYLLSAERCGVEIKPLHIVNSIERIDKGNGYKTMVSRLSDIGETIEIICFESEFLFLAAGSLGTTRLLIQAKQSAKLPHLSNEIGKYWSNNGDSFSTIMLSPGSRGSLGGPAAAGVISREIDNSSRIQLRESLLMPYTDRAVQPGEAAAMIMSTNYCYGEWSENKEGAGIALLWNKSSPCFAGNIEYARDMYSLFSSPDTDINRERATHSNLTTHPLGGAVLGRACDQWGRAKGYQKLYVVDGASMPGSTAAANPSLTIAAFAERNLDRILEEDL